MTGYFAFEEKNILTVWTGGTNAHRSEENIPSWGMGREGNESTEGK